MAKTSLLLKLSKHKTSQASQASLPFSGPAADKPSPVSQEAQPATPRPSVPPNSKPISLLDKLKARGVEVKPVIDSPPRQESGKGLRLGESTTVKASLIDKLRAQVSEKAGTEQAKLQQKRQPVQEARNSYSVAPIPPIAPASQDILSSPRPELSSEVPYAGSRLSLSDRIALAKRADIEIDSSFEPSPLSPEVDSLNLLDRYGRPIQLNEKQAAACQMAIDGESFVLTGEAGTGKSTTIEAVLTSLLFHHRDKIRDVNYRMNDRSGGRISGPSTCVCAYTRKAIGNVARILSHNFSLYSEMEGALQTVHNLLEYSPVVQWSEIQEREVKIFKPQRGEWDPLAVTHLVIEEASMLGLDLWEELRAALNPGVQIIYVGDINQLPPVFGKSVMSYALTKLPIVHLDVVYRQALDNPIIAAAHAVLHGNSFDESPPAVKWIKGKSKVVVPEETMSRAMGKLFEMGLENSKKIEATIEANAAYDAMTLEERATATKPKSLAAVKAEANKAVVYSPDEDVVLIPFNVNAMGTKQINYRIAQRLGEMRQAEVHEIIAGYEKHYLAEGDKVMVNKMEGIITKIAGNMNYMGKSPMPSSVNLSRFGFYLGTQANKHNGDDDFGLDELDIDIEHTIEEEEERKQQASHVVTCELETGQTVSISSAGEFNGQIFQLGYALSVHKAQGSEWRRVFLLFHKNHAMMLSRELLYTAMTRAREELVIVARPELINKAIRSPRIKGNSLAEKIEYFNSGYLDEDIEVTV